ncbi:MAG: response regulator transcription factor [Ekhidna sp.]|nr:response regulator transcription factor [Ekhidna sp.]
MNAIIIEDEQLTAKRLLKLINEHTSIEVLGTLHSVKSAKEWFQAHESPDILLLDIQLGDGTGFDILDSMKSYPQVIFTTAFDQYVLKIFKYNSIDYLLKPIKTEDLIKAVEKAKKVRNKGDLDSMIQSLRSGIHNGFKKKFLVKTGLKYRSINTQDIAFFYSESSTTYLKTSSNESVIIDQSLDEIQTLVDPDLFFRVNRHMIICDSAIKSIDSYFNNRLLLTLIPEYAQQVIVSREKVKGFKLWLDR